MSRLPALMIAAALAAPSLFNAALAATPINETRPLDARGHVTVENLKGRIEVRAWDRREVKIEGSLGQGVEKLEISGDAQHLSVKVKYPKTGGLGFFSGSDKSEPSQLRLMVPLQADLEIDAVSADVDVNGLAAGDLSIDSVSGDVSVVGAPREATIDSVSGDLRLILNSAKVSTESVSGDIELRGRLGGEVHVETVSGDIDMSGHQSSVHKLTGNTVSGDMRIATALAPGGRIGVESVSGNLTLRLPANLSAEVRGESFSGDLTAPNAQISRPKHGPGSSFEHRYGNGDGEVRLESFSGDARLQLD
ncbi:DUF4097 family beta strand repeat-containing protein [Lysobacter solisilvae (ex Woo and Kim 2020)]|uniref:DUF4097 family beta strand repeat protein n=1 Tax=Agrilutibacter terrestris TaxID=2865112 RepID=A0A7H0FU93_9GAMM|nr:DUF4097 family beta strand repeat-containing protein [Lysobacter terrestris]QNP39609.1 DUF4097 family beta strand repeat protein [Lysobacter terrestris]